MLKVVAISLCSLATSLLIPVHATEPDVEVRFSVSQPGLGCWFDRQKDQPVAGADLTWSVDAEVQCKTPRGYRIESTLFTGLPIIDQRGSWLLNAALGPADQSCQALLNSEQYAFERYRDVPASTDTGQRWRLCVSAQPQSQLVSTIAPRLKPVEIVLSAEQGGHDIPRDAATLDILFKHNSATAPQDTQQYVANWLTHVKDINQYRVEVHAHASDSGERQYNHDLSLRRLAAVRNEMKKVPALRGVPVWGQAWGEMRLKALNDGTQFDAQNRRVTLVLVPKGEQAVLEK